METNKQFKDKIAVITGGSRGIGRTIALDFARQGAHIAFNYLRHTEAANKTKNDIIGLGVECISFKAHLGDSSNISNFFKKVGGKFNKIDYLINNAASGINKPATELTTKHWDWTMDINAKAPWLCTKESIPYTQPGSCIVNLTSLGSKIVLPNYFAVGVSKASLEAVTRYLAVELAPLGISVNAVAGGYVKTDALNHFPNSKQMLESGSKNPAGKMVSEQDISDAVNFLCSKKANMIRGQTIVIDGGVSLLPPQPMP
tara:strand:+ start:97 stop:870 length:774 start_codon:yes stop_codon:yes gene_type:complete